MTPKCVVATHPERSLLIAPKSFLGELHISEGSEAARRQAPRVSRKGWNAVLNVFNYTRSAGLSTAIQQKSSSGAPGEFSCIKDENFPGSFWPVKLHHAFLGKGKKKKEFF